MNRWSHEQVARLKELASSGVPASVIAAELGKTRLMVLTWSAHRDIHVVKFSPEEQKAHDEYRSAYERSRNARKVAQNLAKRVALRGQIAANPRIMKQPRPDAPVQSKTSAGYRKCLPHVRDMSKTELRKMLEQAFLNTAALQSEASA